jgi:hypothetical protein
LDFGFTSLASCLSTFLPALLSQKVVSYPNETPIPLLILFSSAFSSTTSSCVFHLAAAA